MALAEVKTELHTPEEFQNLWTCQKLIKAWTAHPEWSSYETIPQLYRALHAGEISAPRSSRPLTMAQVVRTEHSHLLGCPSNLLPDPMHAYLLMGKYSDKLDEILRDKPKAMQRAIEDAAFAYYVFERIHPFPDGNGRIGRMIVKAVLKSAELRDPVFHDQRWYGGRRSEHLQALERVGETNNLAHLELFLSQALSVMYPPRSRDFLKSRELATVIAVEEVKAQQDVSGRLLRDIWAGFGELPLYGNVPTIRRANRK